MVSLCSPVGVKPAADLAEGFCFEEETKLSGKMPDSLDGVAGTQFPFFLGWRKARVTGSSAKPTDGAVPCTRRVVTARLFISSWSLETRSYTSLNSGEV